MSYDDQLQSASPRVLVLDYTHLGICVKIVDTTFKLRISSGVCGNRKRNCQKKLAVRKRLEKSSSGVYLKYTHDECNSLMVTQCDS